MPAGTFGRGGPGRRSCEFGRASERARPPALPAGAAPDVAIHQPFRRAFRSKLSRRPAAEAPATSIEDLPPPHLLSWLGALVLTRTERSGRDLAVIDLLPEGRVVFVCHQDLQIPDIPEPFPPEGTAVRPVFSWIVRREDCVLVSAVFHAWRDESNWVPNAPAPLPEPLPEGQGE